jgi:Tfp pilus assembly protein PilX
MTHREFRSCKRERWVWRLNRCSEVYENEPNIQKASSSLQQSCLFPIHNTCNRFAPENILPVRLTSALSESKACPTCRHHGALNAVLEALLLGQRSRDREL